MNKYMPKHHLVDKRIVQNVDFKQAIVRPELFEVDIELKKQAKVKF